MKTKRKITLGILAEKIDSLGANLTTLINEKIDGLARMTKNGFDDLEDRLTKKIDGVHNELRETKEDLTNRSERIERRIDNTLVSQVQLGKLESRVEVLEKKTGVR